MGAPGKDRTCGTRIRKKNQISFLYIFFTNFQPKFRGVKSTRSHLKNRILVLSHGGAEFQTGGILQYFEDLKRGTNKDTGPKNIFEIASNGQKKLQVELPLFTLPSLMARFGQQFSVFMFSHFFSSFFYDAAQQITSSPFWL